MRYLSGRLITDLTAEVSPDLLSLSKGGEGNCWPNSKFARVRWTTYCSEVEIGI